MKIVVIGGWNLSDNQKGRLEKAGDVTYKESPETGEQWLKAVAKLSA
jgi:hypothetical protein